MKSTQVNKKRNGQYKDTKGEEGYNGLRHLPHFSTIFLAMLKNKFRQVATC